MSYRILDMEQLRIDRIEQQSDSIELHFTESRVEKVMDNAEQRTLWSQAGCLELSGVQALPELPETPFVIQHADVEDSLYTQRDMIRIPLDASGEVVVLLQAQERAEPLRLVGSRIRLCLEGEPRYLQHID